MSLNPRPGIGAFATAAHQTLFHVVQCHGERFALQVRAINDLVGICLRPVRATGSELVADSELDPAMQIRS